MHSFCRNNYIERSAVKKLLSVVLAAALLTGCGSSVGTQDESGAYGERDENAQDSHVDFARLKKENEDIFAWIYVPDSSIDYPVCQNLEGDDSFYITHNYQRQADPKGAIYTESANLTNMCDFNEVLHGSSPEDGSMFADLQKFMDKKYFDEHEYIYIYTKDNALVYYIYAAFLRNDTRLLEIYDFTYASGCQAFIDEIDGGKSMNKMLRTGWEGAVKPENFIITLTTRSKDDPSRQIVVIGCLVGDAAGTIDRVVDYSEPDREW